MVEGDGWTSGGRLIGVRKELERVDWVRIGECLEDAAGGSGWAVAGGPGP